MKHQTEPSHSEFILSSWSLRDRQVWSPGFSRSALAKSDACRILSTAPVEAGTTNDERICLEKNLAKVQESTADAVVCLDHFDRGERGHVV